ncbi:hypothetical protein FY528_00960 [Hymenobacter lutimineralis]|uniref:Lipoprotein n=1 Tax=Hymenobacter lutimineralis TaxID=2606448 RepID=A0A5D6VHR3_9BACT|nr:hypothetical protein [Hymenobacter lutimineralis]TYZ14329.1 hypothetical protein FY528_00960 [Hymenobacter lutimineralis]
MKRLSALLLTVAATASLAACDYNNTPGKDPQASQDFTEAPPARKMETERDSINGQQEAHTPIGTGSAADQKTSADAALEGSPSNPNSPATTLPKESAQQRGSAREE